MMYASEAIDINVENTGISMIISIYILRNIQTTSIPVQQWTARIAVRKTATPAVNKSCAIAADLDHGISHSLVCFV